MEPQQTPPTPQTPSQPGVAPAPAGVVQAGQQPAQTVQAASPIQTTQPAQVPTFEQPKKSSALKWIAIAVGGILGLIIVVGLALFLLFDQSKAASNLFMDAITKGDAEKAMKYVSDSEASTREFVVSAASASKGEFELVENEKKDDKAYYLYSLTNATNKYGRTTVEKVNGTWKVSGYVYSASKLAVVPGEAVTEDVTTSSGTSSASCLVDSDFDAIYQEINGSARPSDLSYSKSGEFDLRYTSNVHFLPDSLNFADASLDNDTITAFGNFGTQNSSKQFAIHLSGSVATTAAADLAFANQRADKIKGLLTTQGVEAAKVVVETPKTVADAGGSSGDDAAARAARTVILTIVPKCEAAS